MTAGAWQAVSSELLRIRARWRDAPAKLGPYSRHPRSIDLLRHARADIEALLAEVDSTQGDPVGALCYELAQLGGFDISIVAVDPKAGTRARFRVVWSSGTGFDTHKAAEGWSPAVALRKAIRTESKAHSTDSDRLTGGRA